MNTSLSLATPKWKEIETRYQCPMADILVRLYDKHGHLSNAQEVIAAELGISQPTLSQWIKILRLEFKKVLLKPENESGEAEPEPA